MKRMIICGLIAALSGCASHRVRCNGVLRPINAPDIAAPASRAAAPTGTPGSGAP